MSFNSITDIEILLIYTDVLFFSLFLYFILQLRQLMKKIEEEEMLKMLKKKYEKSDR